MALFDLIGVKDVALRRVHLVHYLVNFALYAFHLIQPLLLTLAKTDSLALQLFDGTLLLRDVSPSASTPLPASCAKACATALERLAP